MRKILIPLVAMLMWGFFSCKNSDWQFDDFDYTTTYFPYQYPIRTLVLGNYMWDNANDNNLKFKISARVGGMYENKSNWTVDYMVDPGLVAKLAAASNLLDGKTAASRDTLIILPSEYYTLTPADQLVISAGSFVGDVEVQLTDAFLNDPLAVKTRYVLPLSILSSTTDTVLSGKTSLANPDPRKSGDWVIRPKYFTIFGIKFVNTYHGKYLHRGVSVITDTTTSTVLETIVYRQKYVEKDEIWSLQTIARNAVRSHWNTAKNTNKSWYF